MINGKSILIPRGDDAWNPLEDGAMSDIPPAKWNGPHVSKRMAEAFVTLKNIPARIGPRSFGRAWPEFEHDWADLMAQADTSGQRGRMGAEERERDSRVQNRTRNTPTIEQVTRMETVLEWVPRYLWDAPALIFATNALAYAHAFDRDADWLAKKHGGYPETWQARHWRGCEIVARGLVIDKVAVF